MKWLHFIILCSTAGFGLSIKTKALPPHRKRHPKLQSDSSIQYLVKPTTITIPILIHIDKPLTEKLSIHTAKTKRKLKNISNEILKRVEEYFKLLTSNYRIHFKLLDTKFLKNKTEIVAADENASKYLKSYCGWQSKKKSKRWFYSVLFTGLDLFYVNEKGEEVRRSTARSYMGSMCTIEKSCTILEWHPTNSGYLLAHEIAHSLGIFHDGPPHNLCKAQDHVMGAQYSSKSSPRTWSPCSRQAFRKFLLSKKAWCLRR